MAPAKDYSPFLSLHYTEKNPPSPSLNAFQHQSVLFVCLGNICRSPAAEGVFLALLEKQNLVDQFQVDSAGTIGYHAGHAADTRMIQAAAKRGYALHSRSRKITHQDLDNFDLVVSMDRDNQRDILLVNPMPSAELKLLSDFLDDSWPSDVPDPYYGGNEGFEYVLDMLETACPSIIDFLKAMPAREK